MKLKAFPAGVFQSCTTKIRPSWSAMHSQLYSIRDFNMWLTLLVDLLHEPKLSAHSVRIAEGKKQIGWRILRTSNIGELYILEHEFTKFKPDVCMKLQEMLDSFEHNRLPLLFTDIGDGGDRSLIVSLDIVPTKDCFEKALRLSSAKQTSLLN